MRRIRVTTAVLAGLVALSLAGCAGATDGDGIATADGKRSGSSASPVPSDPRERGRLFARCMREQGVDLADPDAHGGTTVVEGGEGQDVLKPMDMDKVQKAHQACRRYAPAMDSGPKPDAKAIENMRKFSRCMRENGVPQFPDPDPNGAVRMDVTDDGLDMRDPTFQAAERACRKYQPEVPHEGAPR